MLQQVYNSSFLYNKAQVVLLQGCLLLILCKENISAYCSDWAADVYRAVCMVFDSSGQVWKTIIIPYWLKSGKQLGLEREKEMKDKKTWKQKKIGVQQQ